jgi:hypothetical protein
MAASRRLISFYPLVLAVLLIVTSGCQSPQSAGLRMSLADGAAPAPRGAERDLNWQIGGAERTSWIQSLAVNETVGLQVHLSADTPPLGPLDLQVGDFIGPGERLPGDQVSRIYRVEPLTVSRYDAWAPSHLGTPLRPRRVGDLLVPWDAPRGGGPVNVGSSGVDLWVDFSVPPTATPGRYTSSLQIVWQDQVIDTVELVLQVLPIAIPGERSLAMLAPLDVPELLSRELGLSNRAASAYEVNPDATDPDRAQQVVQAAQRLLHEHRVEPLLDGLRPRFRLAGEDAIEVDWATHDAFLAEALSGSGFADGVGSRYWLLPASRDYPNIAQYGGIRSARYAKVLIDYLRVCEQHLDEQGWAAQPLVRFEPPSSLPNDPLRERMARLCDIVRLAELESATVVHLPPESLVPLGWPGGETIKSTGVGAWASPAQWLTPSGIEATRALGHEIWFMPDQPPYAASLSAAGLAADLRSLGWQAYCYGLDGVWLEAADGSPAPLLHSGRPYGIEGPLPTVRLKRLRRAQQDYELLELLAANGQESVAQQLARRIVPYGFSDACGAHLLNLLPASWPVENASYERARFAALAALAKGASVAAQRAVLPSDYERTHLTVEGVRIAQGDAGLAAILTPSVVNQLDTSLAGSWSIPSPPPSWGSSEPVDVQVSPGTQRQVEISLPLEQLTFSPNGLTPIQLNFEVAGVSREVPGRLAAMFAPKLPVALSVDGRLDDWPTGVQNTIGDFQLVRYREGGSRRPTLGTQARFAFDDQYFYAAIVASLEPGERPTWQADNVFPVDGAIPWEQDVVELILSPENALVGGPEVLRLVRVKPSGLVATFEGCPTRPQIGMLQRWAVDARVAVSIGREAWTVELALPLESLRLQTQAQPIWGINVARLDARRGEYSSWSGAVGDCYRAAALGNLLFRGP